MAQPVAPITVINPFLTAPWDAVDTAVVALLLGIDDAVAAGWIPNALRGQDDAFSSQADVHGVGVAVIAIIVVIRDIHAIPLRLELQTAIVISA